MESGISATQLGRNLSDVLNRVRYRGEVFVVERGGQPICRIEPVGPSTCSAGELKRLLQSGPRPDDDFWGDLERVIESQPPMPEVPW